MSAPPVPDKRTIAALTLAVHGQGDGADAARACGRAGAAPPTGRALWQAAERAWEALLSGRGEASAPGADPLRLGVPATTPADADTYKGAYVMGYAGVLQRRR